MQIDLSRLPSGSYVEDAQVPPFSMVYVQGGGFWMGSKQGDEGANYDESPQHRVELPDFYLGQYPVTQALWQAVSGENPSSFPGANRPVE